MGSLNFPTLSADLAFTSVVASADGETKSKYIRVATLIVIIRHGESEANCDRMVNLNTANHQVSLTSNGHAQAIDAGKEIAAKVRKGEKVLVYKSPYQRTRQTSQRIEEQLAESKIDYQVIEEPRLREQDFGNFQDPELMREVLEERSRYGSFFFRIPNGESAADVYDRCCHFSESLHRHFDYYNPDVVIMVSHGIWGRVFLMKWFNWSYEHFENIKNLDYCDPIYMERELDKTSYNLITELATWDREPTERIKHARSRKSHSEGVDRLK